MQCNAMVAVFSGWRRVTSCELDREERARMVVERKAKVKTLHWERAALMNIVGGNKI